MVGRLVLGGAPLGQPGDVGPRLREVMASADVLAVEDTRRLHRLASDLGVTFTGRIVTFHESVEKARLPGLMAALADGATVLLLTDAGMPSVSDPGYTLVRAAIDAGVPVTSVPGPSAVTTALAVSGLPVDRFCFEGFLPRKGGERRSLLAGAGRRAPHDGLLRVAAPAGRLARATRAVAFGRRPREAAVCRELTKTYEEIRRGPLSELAEWAAEGVKGEITLVVAGAVAAPVDLDPAALAAAVAEEEAAGATRKDAIRAVVVRTGSAQAHRLRRRPRRQVPLSRRDCAQTVVSGPAVTTIQRTVRASAIRASRPSGWCRSAAVTWMTCQPAARSLFRRCLSLANCPSSACHRPSYSSASLCSGHAKSTRATKRPPCRTVNCATGHGQGAAPDQQPQTGLLRRSRQTVGQGAHAARPARIRARWRGRRATRTASSLTTPAATSWSTATTASSVGSDAASRNAVALARRHAIRSPELDVIRGQQSPAHPDTPAAAGMRRRRHGEFDVVPRPGQVDAPEDCGTAPGHHGSGNDHRGRCPGAQRVRHREVDVDVDVLEQSPPGRPAQLVRR